MQHRVEGQPTIIKMTHWLGAILLVGLAFSGLQIAVAYPHLGPRGQTHTWWPLQGWVAPENLRIGGWLGGARAWHFALMWPLVGCGLVYFVFLSYAGRWRTRVFIPMHDALDALTTLKNYLRFKRQPHSPNTYNGLQKAAYSFALFLIVLEVLSGFVMWKPVQLWWLGLPFGGYEGARLVHLIFLFVIAAFVVVHVVMVLLHPTSLLAMTVRRAEPLVNPVNQTQSNTEPNHDN